MDCTMFYFNNIFLSDWKYDFWDVRGSRPDCEYNIKI